MRMSPKGLRDLILHEGMRRKAYLCSAGVPTIGVGHTKGVKLGDVCTIQQAYLWLSEDVTWAEKAVLSNVKVPLIQCELDALVSFVFNVGEPRFKHSTLLRMLNMSDRKGAAGQFKRWIAGGAGLLTRRQRESTLFLGGKYASDS